MRLLSWIVFLIMVIVEGTITSVPLTLIFLLCLTVMKRQEWIFPLACIAGITLDFFTMRSVGISSLFLLTYVFLILLYQRKYETATIQFVVLASLIGSMLFLLVTGQEEIFIHGIVSTIIATGAFMLYTSIKKAEVNDGFQKV